MAKRDTKELLTIGVGLLAVIASAYVAYDLAARAEKPPGLTIQEVTSGRLFEALLSGEFKFQFKDRIVTNAWMTIYQVSNSGRKAIGESDFWDPVQFNASPPTSMIAVLKLGTKPTGFDFEFIRSNETFTLKPLKLNLGDTLAFLMVTESPQQPSIGWKGRLAGSSHVVFRNEQMQVGLVQRIHSPSRYLPRALDLIVDLTGLEVFFTIILAMAIFLLGVLLLRRAVGNIEFRQLHLVHLFFIFLLALCNGENLVWIHVSWNRLDQLPLFVWLFLGLNIIYYVGMAVKKSRQ